MLDSDKRHFNNISTNNEINHVIRHEYIKFLLKICEIDYFSSKDHYISAKLSRLTDLKPELVY